jgi:hypothetical protein
MALEQKKLDRALKCQVSVEDKAALENAVQVLLAEQELEGPTDSASTLGSVEIGLAVKGEI